MHLIHSAIRQIETYQAPADDSKSLLGNEIMLRYQAYQTACRKHSHEIAAIQKYLPGWLPEFR